MRAIPYITFWILFSGIAHSETHVTSPTGARQAAVSSTAGILSACLSGRPLSPADLTVLASRDAIPTRELAGPAHQNRLVSLPQPRTGSSSPSEVSPRDLEACLSKVKPFADSCITVLGVCVAETARGGTRPLKEPLVVSGGTPCAARVALKRQACAQGIFPDEFRDGDIRCGAAQF